MCLPVVNYRIDRHPSIAMIPQPQVAETPPSRFLPVWHEQFDVIELKHPSAPILNV